MFVFKFKYFSPSFYITQDIICQYMCPFSQSWSFSFCEQWSVDINAVTADTVDFHSRMMASCLSPTSVPFLALRWLWLALLPPLPHSATCGQSLAGGLSHLLGCCWLHGGAPMGLGCGPGVGVRAEEEERGARLLTEAH